MLDGGSVSFGIAFLAGMLTFVAPCVLPVLPAYLSYIASVGLQKKDAKKSLLKSQTFISSIFFVLGFLVVFTPWSGGEFGWDHLESIPPFDSDYWGSIFYSIGITLCRSIQDCLFFKIQED